ncbi:MAG: type IV secretion system protein [Micavibrio aeruginosavorus]|uniref:Type IV secretion system protein n=1 Tax=Micavibrio aeruginosavorus TaxID=349221 RepID=A0A2W5N2M6_9BACT|nr:MAG: type IV secretion system protein [Micavibrio aeruginosavorus]
MSDGKRSTGSEVALGWGILLCVFAALAYLIWWKMAEEIRSTIRWIRYGEMWLMSFFVSDDYTVNWRGEPTNYKALMNIAKGVPADRIDSDLLSALSTVSMQPYMILICVLTAFYAFWALFRGPGTEHRQTFDLNGLIKKQANIFPIISPFIDFNPAKLPHRPPGANVPAELPMFAEALSPEEWIVYNEIPVADQKIDEEATLKAFSKQLGGRWKGAKNLAPYKQILLASCCLKASRKRADADVMLGRLAKCWSEKGLNLSKDKKLLREARAILGNVNLASSVLRKCNEHAWENTAMIRGLHTARTEGGVLAPAQFVWLRAHDRALWYPLNNLGRQSLHMEALGAMAHYKAEKLAQRPIPRPKVGDAVKTLVEYMASNKVRTLPQIDYSNSKKRGVKKLKKA